MIYDILYMTSRVPSACPGGRGGGDSRRQQFPIKVLWIIGARTFKKDLISRRYNK